MRQTIVLAPVVVMAAARLWAGTTPLDALLPEDKVTRITCEGAAREEDAARVSDAPPPKAPGAAAEKPPPREVREWHYDLYLPRGYTDNKSRRYPCLFIASPGGNANMGLMEARIKSEGWIAVMLIESKNENGDWLPNFLTAHDDAVKRLRIHENWKFGTGLSGGARVASGFPWLRDGVRGTICQSAGTFYSLSKKPGVIHEANYLGWENRNILLYATLGQTDMCLSEGLCLRAFMPANIVRNVEVFDGGHEWAPAAVFDHALEWMERTIFITLPPQENDADMARRYFDRKLEEYERADSPFKKYEIRETLCLLAGRYKLEPDREKSKELEARIKASKDEMLQLAKDAVVKNELLARAEYLQTAAKEAPAFEPLDPRRPRGANQPRRTIDAKVPNAEFFRLMKEKDKLAAALPGYAAAYRNVAKKYPGTAYAAIAEARAKSIEIEASKPK